MPSLSRNGTILLELKRHYVSQRLNELQITLGQIRHCQQHDSKSKQGTRGQTHPGSSANQQEQGERYRGVDGCSPPHSQPASQSPSQLTVERGVLSNNKPESHIFDQERSGSAQSNNPETLMDCQMRYSQDHLHHNRDIHHNVPGRQVLNSQITIENTRGHTDIDDM